MLPDFIVIGAMKAGTTSLFQYLRPHPQVFMPWRKEVDFFSSKTNWPKGVGWYEEHFAGAPPGHKIGEASPNYSKRHLWPETPDRLMDTLPEVRIIYLVRDPIVRLQSMYLDMLSYGGETRSIGRALANIDYVLTSSYGMQIEPYVARLGRDRVLVDTSERLRAEPAAVMQRIFAFLDVDPAFGLELTPIEANPSASKRIPTRLGRFVRRRRPDVVDTRKPVDEWTRIDRLLMQPSDYGAARISPRMRRDLEGRFRPDLRHLQELVDVDLSGWRWLNDQ
jgi:hypothetical protein